MSWQASTWAQEQTAGGIAPKALLILLGNYADPEGRNAFPKVSRLAEELECSERTIQLNLQKLVARGLIVRGDEQAVAHLPIDRRPSVWDLTISTSITAGQAGVNILHPVPEPSRTTEHNRRSGRGEYSSPRSSEPDRGEPGFTPGVKQASPPYKEETPIEPNGGTSNSVPERASASGSDVPSPPPPISVVDDPGTSAATSRAGAPALTSPSDGSDGRGEGQWCSRPAHSREVDCVPCLIVRTKHEAQVALLEASEREELEQARAHYRRLERLAELADVDGGLCEHGQVLGWFPRPDTKTAACPQCRAGIGVTQARTGRAGRLLERESELLAAAQQHSSQASLDNDGSTADGLSPLARARAERDAQFLENERAA